MLGMFQLNFRENSERREPIKLPSSLPNAYNMRKAEPKDRKPFLLCTEIEAAIGWSVPITASAFDLSPPKDDLSY